MVKNEEQFFHIRKPVACAYMDFKIAMDRGLLCALLPSALSRLSIAVNLPCHHPYVGEQRGKLDFQLKNL